MRSRPIVVAAAIAVLSALGAAPDALARPTVAVTRVDVPPRDGAPRLAREIKKLIDDAARHTSFGPGDRKKRIEITARLVELSAEERGDVLEIHCTLAGRVVGARGAKSKIAFGGSPKDRAALEKQVLKMVAQGLVARLAQIARESAE
ncbi:MAG TPA: hypothetical protein VHB21_15380 [Minicystis sp.]|nr:hypothetical protein [Minicystis sp.]